MSEFGFKEIQTGQSSGPEMHIDAQIPEMDSNVEKYVQKIRHEYEMKLKELEYELREKKTKLHMQEKQLIEFQKKCSFVKETESFKSELQTIKNAESVSQVEEGSAHASPANVKFSRNKDSAIETEVSHRAGSSASKRCAELLLEEPPRKIFATSRAGATELVLDADLADGPLDGCRRTSLHCHARAQCVAGAATELVSAVDRYGRTALHRAAREGCVAGVRKLLADGADTRSRDTKGKTPLHLALEEGQELAAEVLLEADRENDLQDSCGWTPLHYAAMKGNAGSVRRLLHAGANTRVQNKSGSTPLHLALWYQKKETAELLSNADGDNSLQDCAGRTPLHTAAWRGYVGVVRNLLFSGAHPHLMNYREESAFEIAARTGQSVIAKMIFAMCSLKDIALRWNPFRYLSIDLRNEVDWQYIVQYCVELAAECEVEIAQMKALKVHGSSLSYFDIATRHSSQVMVYLGNEEVRKVLLQGSTAKCFHHYSDLLAFRVDKAEKRRIMTDQSLKCFTLLPRELPCLPEVIIGHFLENLTQYEIETFIKAFIRKA